MKTLQIRIFFYMSCYNMLYSLYHYIKSLCHVTSLYRVWWKLLLGWFIYYFDWIQCACCIIVHSLCIFIYIIIIIPYFIGFKKQPSGVSYMIKWSCNVKLCLKCAVCFQAFIKLRHIFLVINQTCLFLSDYKLRWFT